MSTATPIFPVPGKRPAPNTRLVEMTSDLVPGQALELGCGNGGDALWLAQRGWKVTALDISATSLDPSTWQVRIADAQQRMAIGPKGRTADVTDHILMIQRTER
jgi:SAM-dependent methyltransferase